MVARFKREAAAAAKIRSPHVVQVFDHGTMSDGTPFIVMELLEGESLGDRLSLRSMSVDEVVEVVRQTAKALTDAHDRGIVHRDIKPDNIFLSESAGELHVKVLDFGIAKSIEMTHTEQLTGQGMVLGTPDFMSPEQLTRASAVDFQCDLWALSVVTYRAITGYMPFVGETLGSLIVSITNGAYLPATHHVPALGAHVDAWFLRGFSRVPHARFGSAMELAETLRTTLTPNAPARPSGARGAGAHTVAQGPAAPSPAHVPVSSWSDARTRDASESWKAPLVAVAALATTVAVVAGVVFVGMSAPPNVAPATHTASPDASTAPAASSSPAAAVSDPTSDTTTHAESEGTAAPPSSATTPTPIGTQATADPNAPVANEAKGTARILTDQVSA